jgi:hypothetical protein
VFSVVGGKDQVVGWKYPRRALDRLTRDGLAVDTLFYPDATHAFDDDRANDPRAQYRPDLFSQTQSYFAKALGAARTPLNSPKARNIPAEIVPSRLYARLARSEGALP